MTNNLTFEEIKELVQVFVSFKLNSLSIGDFSLQKSHYEATVDSANNKTSIQEDPLFYSTPNLPPEIQALLSSMNQK